jgi:hypothetical protein
MPLGLAHSRALTGEVIADRMPLDSAIKRSPTGHKAMWYAFAHRERAKAHESGAKAGGPGKRRGSEPNASLPPRPRISETRKILDHSEALGQDVLADRAANVH